MESYLTGQTTLGSIFVKRLTFFSRLDFEKFWPGLFIAFHQKSRDSPQAGAMGLCLSRPITLCLLRSISPSLPGRVAYPESLKRQVTVANLPCPSSLRP